jgi:DNA-binding transcriptional LysR family regulator
MSVALTMLQTFVRTVEAGSFTAVAKEMNSSQPTVSRQIATLEDHLGCLLFQRTTRTLALTDDGRIFYEHALRTLETAKEAENSVGRRKSKPSGVLRLACSVVLGRLHVIPRLPRFRTRYPDIEVEMLMNEAYSDLIGEGIDLAIRVGEAVDSNLIARRIALGRRVLVATPKYLAARGTPQHPSDLRSHDCIVYDQFASGANWSFATPEGSLAVPVRGPVRSSSTEGVRAAVLNGLGIGYAPLWAYVDGEIESGRLVVLLRDFEPSPVSISAVYPSRRFLAPKVRVMIDFLATEFSLDPHLSDSMV